MVDFVIFLCRANNDKTTKHAAQPRQSHCSLYFVVCPLLSGTTIAA